MLEKSNPMIFTQRKLNKMINFEISARNMIINLLDFNFYL